MFYSLIRFTAFRFRRIYAAIGRAPVAQFKRWPTDLAVAVASLSPVRGEIFTTVNGVPSHTVLHYEPVIVLI